MKYFFIAIFAFLLVFNSVAQDSNFTDAELERLSTNLDEVSSGYYLNAQSRNVEGDPYFNSDWLRGYVKINDKAQSEDLMLRLNTEDNILEFTKGEQVYLMDARKIKGFTIYGQSEDIIFRNGFKSDKNDINNSTFLRIIYDGDVKMVAYHTSSLKKDIPTYGSASINDKYVDNTEYFFIDLSKNFNEIKLKKKDVVKKLKKDLRSEIENYADKKGLKFDEEKDLKKILAKYDELSSQAKN